jgi:hypothetical protein
MKTFASILIVCITMLSINLPAYSQTNFLHTHSQILVTP